MKICFQSILILLFIFGCNDKPQEKKQLRWLGDIPFDERRDKTKFKVCNGEENIKQYFNHGNNIEIDGDKPYINLHFNDGFDSENITKESGLIRIRFIVNCEGQTDRFRLLESNLNYSTKEFNPKISTRIMSLTKSLKGWRQKKSDDGNPVDYYQYLIFKIVEGKIVKILP